MTITGHQDKNKTYCCVWLTPETILLSFNYLLAQSRFSADGLIKIFQLIWRWVADTEFVTHYILHSRYRCSQAILTTDSNAGNDSNGRGGNSSCTVVMVMVLMIEMIVVVVDNGGGQGCGSGSQQYTNPRCQVTQVTKFCTVVPNTNIFLSYHYALGFTSPFWHLEF
jgi:hypothetical protein